MVHFPKFPQGFLVPMLVKRKAYRQFIAYQTRWDHRNGLEFMKLMDSTFCVFQRPSPPSVVSIFPLQPLRSLRIGEETLGGAGPGARSALCGCRPLGATVKIGTQKKRDSDPPTNPVAPKY